MDGSTVDWIAWLALSCAAPFDRKGDYTANTARMCGDCSIVWLCIDGMV